VSRVPPLQSSLQVASRFSRPYIRLTVRIPQIVGGHFRLCLPPLIFPGLAPYCSSRLIVVRRNHLCGGKKTCAGCVFFSFQLPVNCQVEVLVNANSQCSSLEEDGPWPVCRIFLPTPPFNSLRINWCFQTLIRFSFQRPTPHK